MLLKLGRRYASTVAGAIGLLTVVGCASYYASQIALRHLVEGEVGARGQAFAQVLLQNETELNALLTGLSRTADAEVNARIAGNAANLLNFSIFNRDGQEVFTPRSTQNEWLLRERPGGTATGVTLSQSTVGRPSPWIATEGLDGPQPTAIVPLDRGGERIGFLSVSPDMAQSRQNLSDMLRWMAWIVASAAVGAVGVPAGLIWARRHRTQLANERIRFLADFDPLTQLLNRQRMQKDVDRILATSRATRERMALWAINLEGLSGINSSLGQEVGDELLRVVADRIGQVMAKTDLFGRMGAGDFRLLHRSMTGPNATLDLVRAIRQQMEQPVEIGGHSIVPRVFIGIALAPEHGRSFFELARHSDLALTVCKDTKTAFHTVFEPWMDTEATRRRQIEQDMRTALKTGRFELFYQPIVAAGSGTPKGFEALIRLPDSQGGYISPAEFLPIAEARDLIKPISDWVIDESIRQVALWPEHLYVSINLSPAQFRDDDLFEIVKAALDRHGVDGHRLQIEVVETLLLERSDAVLGQLRQLKQLGVSIAMDDFGTGYSSLGYLWRFPFDTVKIDQSFMVAFDAGEANVRQILETIVALAHNLGMRVTTEGVETQEQARLLAELDCDTLQGFYFSRPKPAQAIDFGSHSPSATPAIRAA
ncbi:putative bifunctional diguanylate cyclase/phosphodiesterase [Aureimonas sp. N4]|uniref:putative bifunctional diguanylate cyclase/phosphodiesterase n=1 Tax=Aureimonas sp. N4 TaxID=1638165 RepID=UPI0009ECA8F8|nr:bifunctional diguanylate cyclase/phosphodiesterase [Aureimonas sp. N4]